VSLIVERSGDVVEFLCRWLQGSLNPEEADYATSAQSLRPATGRRPDIRPGLHCRAIILQYFDFLAENRNICLETTITVGLLGLAGDLYGRGSTASVLCGAAPQAPPQLCGQIWLVCTIGFKQPNLDRDPKENRRHCQVFHCSLLPRRGQTIAAV
jgi:hypothetical protein